MAAFGQLTPENLAAALEDFACQIGGDPYREEAIDGVRLSKDFIGRRGGETRVQFKSMRIRLSPNSPADDTIYMLGQSSGETVSGFPEELIIEEVDGDEDDFEENELRGDLWREDAETISFCKNPTYGRVLIADRTLTYGAGEENVAVVHYVNRRPLYIPRPALDYIPTSKLGGISLLEPRLAQARHAEPVQDTEIDELEKLLLVTHEAENAVERYIGRMAGMMAILRS